MVSARNHLLAATLAGAWRACPPEFDLAGEDLRAVAPLLLSSGAAPLGWWRLRHSSLRTTAVAQSLRDVYRYLALQQGLVEREIQQILGDLQTAGVEAIVIKGWSVARLYPDPALRPYGDFDLVVRPPDRERAEAVIQSCGARVPVDLNHSAISWLGASLGDLYMRSRSVSLDGVEVRVLGPEDELRLLCLHFLHHGGWRPIWLCDVAAAVESRPSNFSWELCLGSDPVTADWIACTVALSHQLLGAEVEDTPVAGRSKNLPRWLAPAILKQWEKPDPWQHPPLSYGEPLAACWRRPMELLPALQRRWPDPITATVILNGPFNEWPRLLYQVAHCLQRSAHFVARLSAVAKTTLTERWVAVSGSAWVRA